MAIRVDRGGGWRLVDKEPRWIQSFDSGEARTIEGFVVDCGPGGCPEECDDHSCQDLESLGNVCSYNFETEAFVDRTVMITWSGVDCEIGATCQSGHVCGSRISAVQV